MNAYAIVEKIHEFTGDGECVVIRESDWNKILEMIRTSSDETLYDRLRESNINLLPINIERCESED